MNEKIINGLNNEELTEEELEKVSGGYAIFMSDEERKLQERCNELLRYADLMDYFNKKGVAVPRAEFDKEIERLGIDIDLILGKK